MQFSFLFFFQLALADDGDVVKGNEEISDHDNEVDQVALESEPEPQQQQPQKVHYQHNMQQQAPPQGPGPARSKRLV